MIKSEILASCIAGFLVLFGIVFISQQGVAEIHPVSKWIVFLTFTFTISFVAGFITTWIAARARRSGL